MPGSPTALVEYGQIRWVQKQQMECLVTDAAVEKAAKADPMQARLRLLRPALIQLHAVCIAVIPLGELPEGLAAAAAWVQQIGGDAHRELDTPQNMGNIVRIGGVIAQLYIVHQPADYSCVGRSLYRKLPGKVPQHVVDRPVGVAHKVEPLEPRLKLSRCGGELCFFYLHQQQANTREDTHQIFPRLLKL